jgi:hypothetical protein
MPNSTIHPGLYFGPKPNGGAGHGLTGLPIPWSLLAHAGAVDALSAVTVRGRGQSAHRGAVAIGSSTVESQRKLRETITEAHATRCYMGLERGWPGRGSSLGRQSVWRRESASMAKTCTTSLEKPSSGFLSYTSMRQT